MQDLEKISNILGADTIKKIYEDFASEPLKESSKVAVDFIKAIRLFTAPIQFLASYQDRLVNYLDKIRNSVPEENQIEAPAWLSGPVIEKLKYLDEQNYLTNLYLNLLARAIDKDRVNEAHPAFYSIIEQLSPDEAVILHALGSEVIYYTYTLDLYEDHNGKRAYKNHKVILNTVSINFSQHFTMYIEHLKSLNLVRWNIIEDNAIYQNKVHVGNTLETEVVLTEFGSLFVKACIPTNGQFL